MSDRELPEIESGKVPLLVGLFVGGVVLFFAWLIFAVLQGGDRPGEQPQDPGNVKEQPNLLGPDEKFRVRFETTAGPFVMEVRPDWAPRGATQFRELVEADFYEGCRFFRVVPNFVVQFGINGEPNINEAWSLPILDEEVKHSNTKGTVTFAKPSQPNSRTTQVFINLADNSFLDGKGFSPIGEIVEGMENVEKFNAEYGEKPTEKQMEIETEGNAYLDREFPGLDSIQSVEIIE